MSPTNMFNLLNTLASIGGLTFNNLNLIYDTETTNLIKTVGPFNVKQTFARGVSFMRNNKHYVEVYPEIIELSIKDYDTGLVIIDTLIRPQYRITKTITECTGITNEMLENKIDIQDLKQAMEIKFDHIRKSKLLAHNGKRFDDKLMIYERLINARRIEFIDTLYLIPVHISNKDKLASKSLLSIYKQLFGTEYPAHRAMSDVDALIKIMQKLGMTL